MIASPVIRVAPPARRRRSLTRLLIVAVLHALVLWGVLYFAGGSIALALKRDPEPIHIRDVVIVAPPEKPRPPRIVRTESIPVPLLAPNSPSESIVLKAEESPPAPPEAPVAPVVHEAPPAPPPPAAPTRVDAALICPEQAVPAMPRKALIDGIEGLVRAEARVQDGVVKEVRFLAGPPVFYDAVRNAMLQYRCSHQASSVIAVQEFNFRIN